MNIEEPTSEPNSGQCAGSRLHPALKQLIKIIARELVRKWNRRSTAASSESRHTADS
jgi:hypothetical protein